MKFVFEAFVNGKLGKKQDRHKYTMDIKVFLSRL